VRVYIDTPAGRLACQTRDISRGGIFLETDYRGFAPGETIELIFPFERGPVVKLRRYPARVIHQGVYGVGLHFHAPVDSLIA
jgi:hypothetical protein